MQSSIIGEVAAGGKGASAAGRARWTAGRRQSSDDGVSVESCAWTFSCGGASAWAWRRRSRAAGVAPAVVVRSLVGRLRRHVVSRVGVGLVRPLVAGAVVVLVAATGQRRRAVLVVVAAAASAALPLFAGLALLDVVLALGAVHRRPDGRAVEALLVGLVEEHREHLGLALFDELARDGDEAPCRSRSMFERSRMRSSRRFVRRCPTRRPHLGVGRAGRALRAGCRTCARSGGASACRTPS